MLKSPIHPEIMKILKPPMVLAVTNELLLTIKKRESNCQPALTWSDPNFFLSNATYWSWMSLTLQGPISQSFQFFLTRAHCSSPFLESTIWHSEGLIKKLCVLNSTSYIFIRGSVSIFLLCRFMFFSGLLSEAEDSGTSQKIWIS